MYSSQCLSVKKKSGISHQIYIIKKIIWHAEDVRLCVERGSVFALLGPSGCGKTTLLKVSPRNKNKQYWLPVLFVAAP